MKESPPKRRGLFCDRIQAGGGGGGGGDMPGGGGGGVAGELLLPLPPKEIPLILFMSFRSSRLPPDSLNIMKAPYPAPMAAMRAR